VSRSSCGYDPLPCGTFFFRYSVTVRVFYDSNDSFILFCNVFLQFHGRHKSIHQGAFCQELVNSREKKTWPNAGHIKS
jgi:hypothetical protein